MSLHLTPLKRQLLQVLSHWNAEHRWCVEEGKKSLFELFDKAEQLGIYLHPNLLIWAIYELEMIEVLSVFKLQPNLEMSADELCRQQSRVSA
ncbi:hypothetical protein EBU99_07665 [bacterium]|nr:hypothetical protein [bacterium]